MLQTKMTFTSMIAWGGSDDNETLQDVLLRISKVAPSVRYTRVDATSGGWPVFRFELDAMELAFIADEFDCEVEDLGAEAL